MYKWSINFCAMAAQVYLVRHFSAGESEERIGQLTGILVGPAW